MKPTYFATPSDFRRWLEEHHASEHELLVGYYRKDSGRPSITWPESVDEALCFGWIDGLRRSHDEHSYTIRFTPRKERSFWSNVNIRRAEALAGEGRMSPAGLRTFEARAGERSGVYSFEQDTVAFDSAQERTFKANKPAWKYFSGQAPSYRKAATWWVISAKKPETKERRLGILIGYSSKSERLPQLANKPKQT